MPKPGNESMNVHTFEVELDGKKLTLETGKIAKQASGAVVVRMGDSVVLVSACAAPNPKPNQSFFPLTCDYREYTYAAGKIPGGYIKREGRPSEKEILTSRMIDRPMRPLFPEGYLNETQIIAMVLSADPETDPGILGIIGAGAALAISDIPFHHIVSAVRVGYGRWQVCRQSDLHGRPRVEAQHHRGRDRAGHRDGGSGRAARYGRRSSGRAGISAMIAAKRSPRS